MNQLRLEKKQLEAQLQEHANDGRCRRGSVTSQQSVCSMQTPASAAPSFASEQMSVDGLLGCQFNNRLDSFQNAMAWPTAHVRGLPATAASPVVVRGAGVARSDQSLVPSPFTPKTDHSVTLFSFDTTPDKFDSCAGATAFNKFELAASPTMTSYGHVSSPHSITSTSPRPQSAHVQHDVTTQLHGRTQSMSSVLGDVTLTLEPQCERDEYLEALDEFLEDENKNSEASGGFFVNQ